MTPYSIKREKKKPGVSKDSKSQYNPSTKDSDKCYSWEDCSKKSSSKRIKKSRITEPKTLRGKVRPFSKKEIIEKPSSISKGGLNVGYERLEDKGVTGSAQIKKGEFVSKKGDVSSDKLEKLRQESKAAETTSYKPKEVEKSSQYGSRAFVPTKKGTFKPRAGFSKQEKSYKQVDEQGKEVAPWQSKSSESLTTVNRRGKGRTMELSKTGGEGAGKSSTGTITNRRGKTREISADRLKNKMERTEGRIKKRIERQSSKEKSFKNPQAIKDRASSRKFEKEERRQDRKRKRNKGSNTQNPKQNRAPLSARLRSMLRY